MNPAHDISTRADENIERRSESHGGCLNGSWPRHFVLYLWKEEEKRLSMIESDRSIINMSRGSTCARPESFRLRATKAAVIGLTKAIAADFAPMAYEDEYRLLGRSIHLHVR